MMSGPPKSSQGPEAVRECRSLRKRTRLFLLLLVVVLSLPFLGKAIHVDDRIYLEVAANALVNPLHPYDYPVIFEGFQAPDAAAHSHLPLLSYYLAVVAWTTGGESEWVFRLAFLVFPMMAAWAFYDLAARYVRRPLAAALLFVLSPAFLVLSQTLKPDLPLLAFWLLAVVRFQDLCRGDGNPRTWWICGGALVGAAFFSLLTLGLVLLLAVWLVLESRRAAVPSDRLGKLGALLLLPFLLWGAWYLKDWAHYGRFVLADTFQHMGKREAFVASVFGEKGLSFLLNLGGAFLFPIAVWAVLKGPLTTRIHLVLVASVCVPFFLWFPEWKGRHILLFSVFLGTGLLLLGEFVGRGVDWLRKFGNAGGEEGDSSEANRDALLVLWFFGIAAACLLVFYSGSVRYVLPALPPAVLVWMSALERGLRPKAQTWVLVLAVLSTLGYSFAIAHADYHFAGLYRKMVPQIVRDYQAPDRTVWFAGEWGFRYYMERAGGRLLLTTQIGPRPGDILVKPYVAMPWVTLYDSEEYLELVEQRSTRIPTPIRLLDFSSHVGFYSTGWGILPVSLGCEEPWEWFNVFRVIKEFDGPIPELERAW